jgi:hypothetical protein
MKRQDLINIPVGVALGLLVAWLLGLFAQPSAPATVASVSAAAAVAPARPILTTMTVAHSNVAMPTAPAVPAHESVPPPVTASSAVKGQPTTSTSNQETQAEQAQRAQVRAVTNNLRQLGNAAQSYMMEKEVTQASYYDLVGDGTDNYLHNITPVVGEDYTGLLIENGQSQVQLTLPDGTTVTYNM